MIRAVIFDVDGTLVDSVDYHARAWQQAFAEHGVKLSYAEVRSQIGKGGDQLMPTFLDAEELEEKGEQIEARREELYRSQFLPRVEAFPRVRQLFEHLRERGISVVLASSAPGEELEVYKRLAKIEDLIAGGTSNDDADRSKPHPDIFEAAFQKLGGLSREEVVVIGDSPFDAIAARRAGLTAIGVLSGGFPPEQLREAGCSAIFRDPEELLRRARSGPDAWLEGQESQPSA